MSKKIEELIEQIEKLTVVELIELVKTIEEKFGLSDLQFPVSGAGPAPSSASAEGEEKPSADKVTVVLTSAGSQKIQVIKALREIDPNLSLKDAKDIVDNPPKTIKEEIKPEEAEEIKNKLEGAGAQVEIK